MNVAVWRSDVSVDLIQWIGGDAGVIASARVSTNGWQSQTEFDADPNEHAGLIRFLMRNRHGTPFEHNSMTFLVSAPIFVFREFHRHRIGWSYNEESGRYKQLEPVFYLPGPERNLVQTGKTGEYRFEPGDPDMLRRVNDELAEQAADAYRAYERLLADGVAKEVARMCLPVNIFSSMYATCNARSLMAFLSLRTRNDNANVPSFPMREIEMVAEQLEAEFSLLMPLTYAAFNEAGRVAP